MSSIDELIKDQNIKIKVRPLLLSFTGLPNSKKTELLENFLQKDVKQADDIALTQSHGAGTMNHFEINDGGPTDFQLNATPKTGLFAYGIFSSLKKITHNLNKLQVFGTSVTEKKSNFESYSPSAMVEGLKKSVPKDTDSAEEHEKFARVLRQHVSQSRSLITIWKYSINSTVFRHILSAFKGKIYNHDMFLIFDYERDFDDLYEPFISSTQSGEVPIFISWRDCLHYLLRLCWYSHINVTDDGETKKIAKCHVVATLKEPDEDVDLKLHKFDLCQTAKHIGVETLLDLNIQAIDISDQQKRLYQKIQEKISQLKEEKIPLSWAYLRTTLNFLDKEIVPRHELEATARKWNIDLPKFLKFFTSFGNILDLSMIDNPNDCKHIIIKPAMFVHKVNEFLCHDDIHFPTINYGIVPKEHLKNVFRSDWQYYVEAMVSIALATPVKVNNLQVPNSCKIDKDETYYYIPLTCSGKPAEDIYHPHSVHLFTSISKPHFFKQVLIVKHLLDFNPKFRLVIDDIPNQVVLKDSSNDTQVTLIWQNPLIRMHINEPKLETASDVICTFNKIVTKSNPKTRFKVIKGLANEQDDAKSFSLAYYVLPGDTNYAGYDNPQLKVWHYALKQVNVHACMLF